MSLFLAMLPVYLLGNLHCMGMCGPLVMLLGQSPFRHFYFFGRLTSFTLAGLIAGGFGAVIGVLLSDFNVAALLSLFFGGTMTFLGICTLFHLSYPGHHVIARWLAPLNQKLSISLLQEKPFAIFLFGFFTILLPCGQTLMVYSACALSGDLLVGTANGFAFALITSPSLLVAMQAKRTLLFARKYYNHLVGGAAIFVGILACLRGLAEYNLIPHLVLNTHYHIVIF
ncbi:MAG: sulfite exporter TauE/SafE family protein [Parachlamydiaceae bacterium]